MEKKKQVVLQCVFLFSPEYAMIIKGKCFSSGKNVFTLKCVCVQQPQGPALWHRGVAQDVCSHLNQK